MILFYISYGVAASTMCFRNPTPRLDFARPGRGPGPQQTLENTEVFKKGDGFIWFGALHSYRTLSELPPGLSNITGALDNVRGV